jgi:selenide,water dikinase
MEDAALCTPPAGPRLIFTVDFITPIVDDPYEFGGIAAANALSDVFAMGGTAQVALAICGFPEDRLSTDALTRILQGGRDKAAEAGCAVVGGHTVVDPELKYGLCVIGSVDGSQALAQNRARPGDQLVLTKPIGTGIAAQGWRKGKVAAAELEPVVQSMLRLNLAAKDAALAVGLRAATDVTGYGLLGHLYHLLAASGVCARIHASRVPRFSLVPALAAADVVPGGTRRNLQYVGENALFDPAIEQAERLLLADAQTSGGLLLAVPAAALEDLLRRLRDAGIEGVAQIGEIESGPSGRITILP